MFGALKKAIDQSFDPAFRQVFLRSFIASLVTFIALWVISWLALQWLGTLLADWLQTADLWSPLETALLWLFGASSVAAIVVASLFLFPSVMLLTMSFLLEEIAGAVDKRYYPGQPTPREQPKGEMVVGALSFAGTTLLVNLLALPFYLILLFLPPFNLFIFYGLNGYLLGREYFELVAQRRLDLAATKSLRRGFRVRVFMAGVIIAFILTIPLLNLVTPIIATAFMLHIFERLRSRQQAGAKTDLRGALGKE